MAASLIRKAVSLGSGQSQINFGLTQKPEIIYIEKEPELQALEFESEVFVLEINIRKQRTEMGIQTLIEDVEELKEQLPVEKIKAFQCDEFLNFFSTNSSLKRHIQEIQSGRAKIYFKHDKVDGRYQCTTCFKYYTHSAKMKKHMQKHHLSEFLIQDKETQQLIPAKRKSNTIESQRDQQERLKRQKLHELMNQPVGNTILACFQAKALNLPALNAIDISSCIDNYLQINVPVKPKLIRIDDYAYKVYPYSYLLKNDQYQNEFANEYMIFRKAQRRDCKNLLKLNGVILSYGYIALRLKKYEITLRDYLNHSIYLDDFNNILSYMIQAQRNCMNLDIHRDLKPENVMINLRLFEVVVIDFNRPLKQEIVTLAKVLGTPGYFPIREKWNNGSVQWDL